MATDEQVLEVRENIGEVIPAGGEEADTMFTNAQIGTWIDGSATLDGATLAGWKKKMANLADLVDVTDGAASRALSDAFDHAAEMVKVYTKIVSQGPTGGRTRIGRIVRTS